MYLLTCIDRYTRWLEVIHLPDISAATWANAFLLHWIAQFGCPLNLITDRGGQFRSELFNNFCINFGINLKNTTAYHPAQMGLLLSRGAKTRGGYIPPNNLTVSPPII